MAQTARNIPANYPQPLGNRILRADAQRQVSMVRQEMVTHLLGVLSETRDQSIRSRLIKLIESNLRSGILSARRSEGLWPSLDDARTAIEGRKDAKPAVVKKHLKLFEQYDRVQRRSLALLDDSFESVRVILERLQPSESAALPSAAAQ